MLEKKEIFVFGSNLAGKHGRGAALYAKRVLGAREGVARGFTGDCYAIPTKDEKIRTLPLNKIKHQICLFLADALDAKIQYECGATKQEIMFLVTRIGCGLAGYKDEDIAPMFRGAPLNCKFDSRWQKYLGNAYCYFVYEGKD